MKLTEKYDNMPAGIISGILFPLIIGLIVFAFSSHGTTLYIYLKRLEDANIVTHAITLCVFPNVLIFLLFNRFDMLRATRGVLAITIVWAAIVFGIKIF
jgi:predicted membrane-bound mannosyltransferase